MYQPILRSYFPLKYLLFSTGPVLPILNAAYVNQDPIKQQMAKIRGNEK